MNVTRKILVFVFFLGLASSVLFFFRGRETQFSPDTLQHRDVTFYYMPFTEIDLFAISGTSYNHTIVQFWKEAGYLNQLPLNASHWDPVTGCAYWDCRGYSGPAKGFWYYGRCNSKEAVAEWIVWSQRHPMKAARLWPKVIGLLHEAGSTKLGRAAYDAAIELMIRIEGRRESDTEFERAFSDWETWRLDQKKELGIPFGTERD